MPKSKAEKQQSGWAVPKHETYVLAEREHDYCLMIPVINEGPKLTKQLKELLTLNLPVDVIIADGGSSDGSNDAELMRALGVNTLLVKTDSGKLSAQMRMGFAFALNRGYKGIVCIDGNGKDGLEAIVGFLQKLELGFGFVQGSRFISGGKAIRTPLDRLLAVRLIHAPALSLAAGFQYSDTTNGFKGYSREFLLDSRVLPFRDVFDTYNLHYYLSVRAPRLKYKVCEIPVTRMYPQDGPTPTKISGIGAKVHILRLLFESCFGMYDPKF